MVAYHSGEFDDARSLLGKAAALRRELVLDGAEDDAKLASLADMGFGSHEAKASLLACAKDVQRAAAHALEKRAEAERLKERRIKERRYGKTPKGSAVNVDGVARLVSLGCEEPLQHGGRRVTHVTPRSRRSPSLTTPVLKT